MYGNITAYSSTTLTVNVLTTTGSGTYAVWSIDTTYAGGGGGGINTFNAGGSPGAGGFGGGGAGGINTFGTAGSVNTGGGGGGSGGDSATGGGAGGSGIVSIRYSTIFSLASSTTGSPSVTTVGGYNIYTWTSSGSITF